MGYNHHIHNHSHSSYHNRHSQNSSQNSNFDGNISNQIKNDYVNINVESKDKTKHSRQEQIKKEDVEKITEYRDVMSLTKKPEDRKFSDHELAESYCRKKLEVMQDKMESRYYQQECEKHSELLLIQANKITANLN